MDRDRASAIAHQGIAIANPIPAPVIDRFVDASALTANARVLDIGCGRGELALRAVERSGCSAVGVDRSPRQIGVARDEAARRVPGADVTFHEADATDVALDRHSFRVVACLGSTQAYGGLAPALARLAELVEPRGWLLIGDGYWTEPPSAAYLAGWNATVDELPDLATLHSTFEQQRLHIVDEYHATIADWDAYETPWAANLEAHARAHPDDPDSEPMLEWVTEARTRRRLGPGVLGFALVLATGWE